MNLVKMNEMNTVAINALLEVLYIIHNYGEFSDKEAIIETLLKIGVTEERIKYYSTHGHMLHKQQNPTPS